MAQTEYLDVRVGWAPDGDSFLGNVRQNNESDGDLVFVSTIYDKYSLA